MTSLSQGYLTGLLINTEVTRPLFFLKAFRWLLSRRLTLKSRNNPVDAGVKITAVFGRPRNDQRRARLINQDGIHLINDRKI